MFKGNLFVTTDINMMMHLCLSNKVVIIGEPDNNLLMQTNGVAASILLPPYAAMMAQIDNDIESFTGLYYQHLNTKECQNFILVILRALMNGTNILLYVTPDEFNMYGKFLLQFLSYEYGIFVGTESSQFSLVPTFVSKLCVLLYLYELITPEQFFMYYPILEPINPIAIPKLVADLNPYVEEQSTDAYTNYFFNLKERIKKNNNVYMISPVRRG